MTPFRHFEPSSAPRARRPPKITSSSCLRLCRFESKTLLKCCNCFLYCSLRIIEISRSHPKIKQFISLEAVIHCTFSRNESSMLLGLARIALLALVLIPCPCPSRGPGPGRVIFVQFIRAQPVSWSRKQTTSGLSDLLVSAPLWLSRSLAARPQVCNKCACSRWLNRRAANPYRLLRPRTSNVFISRNSSRGSRNLA